MRWFSLLVFCCLVSVAWADLPLPPYAYVAVNADGKYFASVVPPLAKGPDWHVILRKPYIALHQCQEDGSFKELWRIGNVYSFGVYLTVDAEFLIVMGSWNEGDRPSKEDVALSFYRDGKLIREFSTAEVIDDPKKVSVSVSHYDWRDHSDARYPRVEGHLFEIKTTEGRVVAFGMDDSGITINKDYSP